MSYLEKIEHSAADDESVEDYACGVVTGEMHFATVNAVASLLARVRELKARLTIVRTSRFPARTSGNRRPDEVH